MVYHSQKVSAPVFYANSHLVATYQSISFCSQIRLSALPLRHPGIADLSSVDAQTIAVHLDSG